MKANKTRADFTPKAAELVRQSVRNPSGAAGYLQNPTLTKAFPGLLRVAKESLARAAAASGRAAPVPVLCRAVSQ
jgi:hypothetical protein